MSNARKKLAALASTLVLLSSMRGGAALSSIPFETPAEAAVQGPFHATAHGGADSDGFLQQLGITKGIHDPKTGLTEYHMKSNGLTILLQERHSAPVVTAMMLYRVGSRNEGVGYTGSTHFLEHMMFKGSSNFDPLKKKGIDDVLKPIGGLNNATTWFDRTAYFEVVPSQYLGLCLQFEADRMRHLLLRSSDRRSEMTVVRNELERNENDPRTLLDIQLFATAFREHPYHHPTIGWRSDVEGVPIERLKKFYDDFYWPNNATLLVIGDFKPAETLKLIVENFKQIPHSPKPIPTVYTVEPPQEGERRFIVERGEDLPKVMIGFHIPRAADPDEYPLAVIESLLGSNNHQSSRLYKRLVDTGLASETSASEFSLRDPGLFEVYASATPGSNLPVLEKNILEELDKLKSEAVAASELQRAKDSIIKRTKLGTTDPLGLAEMIGESLAAADAKYWLTYDDRIRAVTADDIKRVAQKYFTEANRTVGYYKPKSGKQPNTEVQPESPSTQQPGGPAHLKESLTGGQATGLAFSQPAMLSAQVGRTSISSKVKRKVFANGLTVLVMPIPGIETAAIAGKIRAGDYFATGDKSLVPGMLAAMLSKGSAQYSRQTLAEELESLGSSLDFESGNFWIGFETDVVAADIDKFVPLLADTLQRPLCPEDELRKSKKVWESEIEQQKVNTRAVALNALHHALYKPSSVYYEKTFNEQLQELPIISVQDLKDFHKAHFSPANTVLAVVGDVDPNKVFAIFESQFAGWQGTAAEKIEPPQEKQPIAAQQIKISIADKENVDICIGHPVPVSFLHPDYYAAAVANAALGHSPFVSRLGEVRVKHGLTYDIFSTFVDAAYGGEPWMIECSTNPTNAGKVLPLIQSIVNKYVKDGITAAELTGESKHLAGEFYVNLRTPREIAQYLSKYEIMGLPVSFIDQVADKLKSVTMAQANEAIRKCFDLNHCVTTMAGTFTK